MDLSEAVKKALHILEEERVRPTLSYDYVSREWPRELRYDYSLKQQGYPSVGVFRTGSE